MLTKYRKIINRSIDTTNETHGLGGWNPDGGSMSKSLYFSWYNRVYNYTPTLTCSRDIDKFTVSNSIGNGKLTYPVGLLSVDEVMYAGGKRLTGNSTYYLYTNQNWWLSSPDTIINNYVATEYYLGHNGGIAGNTNDVGYGLRPSVSLASTSTITQGDGTATNPYIIA